jgi:hypothetical protein
LIETDRQTHIIRDPDIEIGAGIVGDGDKHRDRSKHSERKIRDGDKKKETESHIQRETKRDRIKHAVTYREKERERETVCDKETKIH